ncbi:MAG TPA: amidohydrolase family protein [Nocardioidaceae bacterium]|nr:amidohydrolase family protein [Nocardioidaceae bacterium]
MTTVLSAAWLFDEGRLVADPVVFVEGARVTAVEYGTSPPDGVAVVDLAGATLVPGLVDTHVHLAFDASADPVGSLAARDDAEALAAMTEAARTALRAGITTVRDLGDRDYLALRLRDGTGPTLPTIVASGPPITKAQGHCHYLGGVAEPDGAGMRAAIREHAERGVDVIKIMASGGTLTPGTRQEVPQFDPAALVAAVDEAHRLGLPITAHAHGTSAIVDVAATDVDGIEHASFWSAEGIDDPPDGLIETIVRKRIAIGASLGQAPMGPDVKPPPAVLARLPRIVGNMRRLHEAGARMVVGTDAGIGPPKPHDALLNGPAQLVEIGFTPAEALTAITSTAADACGLADRKGRIAPGFDADIIAVDGDPMADLGALHRIRAVYARGVEVEGPTGSRHGP